MYTVNDIGTNDIMEVCHHIAEVAHGKEKLIELFAELIAQTDRHTMDHRIATKMLTHYLLKESL